MTPGWKSCEVGWPWMHKQERHHGRAKSGGGKSAFRFTTVTAVVIANMVGTGVFTSLGFQLLEIQSGFALLALWAVGGVAALCGAMTYAELGAALPRSTPM